MTEASFQEILDMPIDEIKDPVALPPGTYLCLVDGQPEFEKIGKNQTDCVVFSLKPLQAGPEVDQRLLDEALDGSQLQDKKIRHRVFLTWESKHRLKKFLINDLGLEGTNFRQLIPEAMGRQVWAKIVNTPSQDGSTLYANVSSTAKV